MCYISSNNNRVYVGLETSYGTVPTVTTQNRIPLVKLAAKQVPEQTGRRDKTGSRTFVGLPNRIRKKTNFQLNTFMTEWTDQTQPPTHSPLFQAALGATPLLHAGGTVASIASQTAITFPAAHGLSVGQGVSFGSEMRFVANIANDTTIILNAPFSTLTAGGVLGTTMTYSVASNVGSVSIFDCWDPSTVVQRILNGAAMNTLKVEVNGDFQEFIFAGPSKDLLDTTSFTSGQGGLTSFPTEPVDAGFDYTIVPGHLGQVWMGAIPTRFFTLTKAELQLDTDAVMSFVRSTYSTCRFEVLYPTDVNHTQFNLAINFPVASWTPAALTVLKTESFGFTFGRDLDQAEHTMDFGTTYGFPATQRSHLVGIGDSTTAWIKEAETAEGKRFESVVLFALDQFCLIGYGLPLPDMLRRSVELGN